jgi:hypothetical protein
MISWRASLKFSISRWWTSEVPGRIGTMPYTPAYFHGRVLARISRHAFAVEVDVEIELVLHDLLGP